MPGAPFEYTFLDANLLGHYRAEQELGTIVSLFTVIGLTVACLGLFALMSLAVAERTKEIGVRKVLGASVSVIVALLARYFLRLVLIANLLAWPVAWFAMHRWLGTFAFRIGMTWWPFILSGCLALAVAVLTVGVQAVKAAMANPVEALRYE